MKVEWNRVCIPDGCWFWWATLPNGWTAWVIDDSIRRRASTDYGIEATAGSMRKTVGFKIVNFATAKSMALSLALSQPERVCRTERIEVVKDASSNQSD